MIEKEDLDVVFIVTNYDEQGRPRYPQLATECLQLGVHAWIEKPPAASTEEVQAMMRASRETGRHIGVGFKKMFFPANVKAKEIISQSEFGRVTSITARYPQSLPPFAERHDSGKMTGFLDHMVHPHSVLRLLGGDIEWLFVNRNDINGAAVVSLRFKSGAVGTLHFSSGQGSASLLERTEVIGEGANVMVDNNLRVHYHRKATGRAYGRESNYFGAAEGATLTWEPEFSLGQLYNKAIFLLGYAPEIIHFTTCLLENHGPEHGTLDDALEILRVYEAYQKADETIHRIET
jgi:predicted dehydrogenase